MSAFVFGDLELTRYCLVQVERPVGPRSRIQSEQIPGRDGNVVVSVERELDSVTAHCLLKARYAPSWQEVRSELAATLSPAREDRLYLPDEGGLWRLAVPSFDSNVTLPTQEGLYQFDVSFALSEAIAHGRTNAVTVPSGGSIEFRVGGTAPCAISISALATRELSTRLWGVRFDDGDYLRVEIPTSSATPVEIDCESRVVRVGGNVSMVTMDSDWPMLTPGRHVARNDVGTGSATLAWEERWY